MDTDKQKMVETIEKQLPEFVKMVKEAVEQNAAVIFNQDAFAASYQEEEFRLLGLAIKYAGFHGREIIIVPNKD